MANWTTKKPIEITQEVKNYYAKIVNDNPEETEATLELKSMEIKSRMIISDLNKIYKDLPCISSADLLKCIEIANDLKDSIELIDSINYKQD